MEKITLGIIFHFVCRVYGSKK